MVLTSANGSCNENYNYKAFRSRHSVRSLPDNRPSDLGLIYKEILAQT